LYAVYVLRNPEGRLYIGFANDLDRRLREHQKEPGGWTDGKGPWSLVHYEEFSDRAEGMRREKSLKSGKPNEELRRRFASPGS